MARLAWYKRFPEDALAGMMSLNPEQRGIYNTILDLIYLYADELPDDDRFIIGWCHCDLRRYRRVKAELISAGKLFTDGGYLRNGRASAGVLEALARGVTATYAAHEKWRKSGRVSSENKDIRHAGAMRQHMPTQNPRIMNHESENLTDAARAREPVAGARSRAHESSSGRRMREHLAELAAKKRRDER